MWNSCLILFHNIIFAVFNIKECVATLMRHSKKDNYMKPKYLTQRSEVKSALANILSSMSYPCKDEIIDGLLDVIDMISDYHEEGMPLFPEIIVAKSEDYFKTFNNYRIKISKKKLKRHEFSQSIKMCAPLAVENWHIYIVVNIADSTIEYGILSTRFKAMSLGLYEQTMLSGVPEVNALYLRNVGNKEVEVRNVSHQFFVTLNLSDKHIFMGDILKSLINAILPQNDDNLRELKNFFAKTIHQALNMGHGNLIAVVSDTGSARDTMVNCFRGGVWLDTPIDLKRLADEYQIEQTESSSIRLCSYACLLQSMLNFDGITLFTDQGRILGYHFIVDNGNAADEGIQGGARTRAFMSLRGIPEIKACFMKSQDGKLIFYSNEQ